MWRANLYSEGGVGILPVSLCKVHVLKARIQEKLADVWQRGRRVPLRLLLLVAAAGGRGGVRSLTARQLHRQLEPRRQLVSAEWEKYSSLDIRYVPYIQ